MNRARKVAEPFYLGEDQQPPADPSASRNGQWPAAIPTGPLTPHGLLDSGVLLSHPDAFWVPYESSQGTKEPRPSGAGSNQRTKHEVVMPLIMAKLDPMERKQCRLVSKFWNELIKEGGKTVARPCYADRADIPKLKEKYPNLVSIDFSPFQKLQESHVRKMKDYKLHIEELEIGAVTRHFPTERSRIDVEPQISNGALKFVAQMTNLKKLTLINCCKISDPVMDCFTALVNLCELTLHHCKNLTEKGLGFLQHSAKLCSFTLTECKLMRDEGLLRVLAKVPSLKRLHIGDVQLSQKALQKFQREGKGELEELVLEEIKLSTGVMSVLESFQSLTAFGMTECKQADPEKAIMSVMQLTKLRRLNLLDNKDIHDHDLVAIATKLTGLQQLQVVLLEEVHKHAIQALAELQDLQACSFECSKASSSALEAMTSLTRLTCAEFIGGILRSELVSALPSMSSLQRLSLANDPSVAGTKIRVVSDVVRLKPILYCSRLVSLDLSYTKMGENVVACLLEGLIQRDKHRKLEWPVLEDICLFCCKIDDHALAQLNRRFRLVLCHRKMPKLTESQTWVRNSSRAFWA